MSRVAPIVGLSGKKRSGKDTAAEVLVAAGYVRFAFADVMKEAALALDPIVGDSHKVWDRYWTSDHTRLSELVEAVGWEYAKEHPEVRRTLQRLGTEMGRNVFGKDFWINRTLERVYAQRKPVVITDVRFPNEARAIEREPHGVLIRINRPGLEATDEHASETALDDYPFEDVIENDKTIDDLHRQVSAIVTQYGY